MSDNPINDMMGLSLDKIRELADANTVVGKPITGPDGTVLIPISKLSVGLATGGADFGGHEKHPQKAEQSGVPMSSKQGTFGGGAGAGVNVVPVAFLMLPTDGSLPRVLTIGPPAVSTLDRAVDLVPDLLNRVQSFLDSRRKKDGSPD